MNILSIFVLSSILAGACYASDSLIKGSDAIADQSSVKLDGSDITLTELKAPAAKANGVEPVLPVGLTEDDVIVDIDDEFDEEDDEFEDEDDGSNGHDSSEDGLSKEADGVIHSEEAGGVIHSEEAGGESLNETTGIMVDDETGEVFYPFEPLPKDVAYDFHARVRGVTNKIHPLFAKPQDLPTLKEAQNAWDLLKQKLAILTPRNAAVASLENLKALELKITEQLNSVTIESVHQLRLDWAEMKKLLDGIVTLHWNLITKEEAKRFVGSVKSEKSLLGQVSAWFSGKAFPASSDNGGAIARRLLGFLE